MLLAVLGGQGTMAQFNHPEFGGGGQWMQGGMIMVGDLFDHAMKSRVDSLCNDLSALLQSQPDLARSGSHQSQSQGDGPMVGPSGPAALFVPQPGAEFWPAELGAPSATGQQNNVRYAYFAAERRLAVQTGSEVWVYDTGDHQIGGFGQQQGGGSSIQFTSQFGAVDLASLPVVSRNGHPVAAEQPAPASPVTPSPDQPDPAGAPDAEREAILATIERLGDLHARGVLDDAEFSAKKAELLARL